MPAPSTTATADTSKYDPNELRQAAGSKIAQADAIEAAAAAMERETDDDESARVDALYSESAEFVARAKKIERDEARAAMNESPGRKTNPWGMGSKASTSNSADGSPTYYTTAGEPVASLGRGEALADWRRSVGLDQPRAIKHGRQTTATAGEAVAGILSGSWDAKMQSALAGGSGPSGGYLLTSEVSSQIFDLARDESVIFRAGARTIPMTTSELTLAGIAEDPTPEWRGENALIPISSVAFTAIKLRARTFAVIVPISRELVADAPNAAAEINRLLAVAAAQEIDRAALLGTGDGEEPLGILNYLGVTENEVGGAVDYDDFLDSIAAIESVNGEANAAIYSPATKLALAKLKTQDGVNGYLEPPISFRELAKFVTNKMTDSTAIVGDFSKLIVGVRDRVEIVATEAANTTTGQGFERNQILVRMIWRGDVAVTQPTHFEKLTGISA